MRYRIAPCTAPGLHSRSRRHRWVERERFYDFDGYHWGRWCTRCGKWYDEVRQVVDV